MSDPRVVISSLSDIDMDQFVWVRNSRLPRDTFKTNCWPTADAIVVIVCAIVGAISVAAFIASAT